jgi:hypothetical protein
MTPAQAQTTTVMITSLVLELFPNPQSLLYLQLDSSKQVLLDAEKHN